MEVTLLQRARIYGNLYASACASSKIHHYLTGIISTQSAWRAPHVLLLIGGLHTQYYDVHGYPIACADIGRRVCVLQDFLHAHSSADCGVWGAHSHLRCDVSGWCFCSPSEPRGCSLGGESHVTLVCYVSLWYKTTPSSSTTLTSLTWYVVRPTGVLHVGANVGQEAQDYASAGIRRVVWIEAQPSLEGRLRAAVTKTGALYTSAVRLHQPGQLSRLANAGPQVLIAAVSDATGKRVRMTCTNNSISSSLLPLGW